ncbi:MAG: type II toxin-antitoxin system HicB family antitoxin [Candidatus Symbiobacter sp.]|nr:type II toxin-antitoxin system HicB family antitoxin [Candidatus Symbiobacter sp.]
MNETLQYRGYFTTIDYSPEDEVFHGRLAFISDLVTWEAETAKEVKPAFHAAVEDYLEACASEGREANLPFKGSFNLRPGPELHQGAALLAARLGVSLNQVVTDALRDYLAAHDLSSARQGSRQAAKG